MGQAITIKTTRLSYIAVSDDHCSCGEAVTKHSYWVSLKLKVSLPMPLRRQLTYEDAFLRVMNKHSAYSYYDQHSISHDDAQHSLFIYTLYSHATL